LEGWNRNCPFNAKEESNVKKRMETHATLGKSLRETPNKKLEGGKNYISLKKKKAKGKCKEAFPDEQYLNPSN